MSGRRRGLFLATCWIPLASFVAASAYVDRYDGWGAWAAAPILLGPVLVSAVFLLFGVAVARSEQPAGRVSPSTWMALGVASGPCLWLAWRVLTTL